MEKRGIWGQVEGEKKDRKMGMVNREMKADRNNRHALCALRSL